MRKEAWIIVEKKTNNFAKAFNWSEVYFDEDIARSCLGEDEKDSELKKAIIIWDEKEEKCP